MKGNRCIGTKPRPNVSMPLEQSRKTLEYSRQTTEYSEKTPAVALVVFSSYSTLIYFSETSVEFQRTTRHYIPQDNAHHYYHSEDIKSYKTL
jgi:predicted RND superfamily exporter protein